MLGAYQICGLPRVDFLGGPKRRHYFSLNEAVVWRSTHGLSTWIAFIDVCTAFDIVDHQCLFWKMRLLGIDTHFIRIVQSLLGRMRRRVLHGRYVS